MEAQQWLVAFFILLAFVTSDAAQTPEDYWKSIYPNIPMPKQFTEIFGSGSQWKVEEYLKAFGTKYSYFHRGDSNELNNVKFVDPRSSAEFNNVRFIDHNNARDSNELNNVKFVDHANSKYPANLENVKFFNHLTRSDSEEVNNANFIDHVDHGDFVELNNVKFLAHENPENYGELNNVKFIDHAQSDLNNVKFVDHVNEEESAELNNVKFVDHVNEGGSAELNNVKFVDHVHQADSKDLNNVRFVDHVNPRKSVELSNVKFVDHVNARDSEELKNVKFLVHVNPGDSAEQNNVKFVDHENTPESLELNNVKFVDPSNPRSSSELNNVKFVAHGTPGDSSEQNNVKFVDHVNSNISEGGERPTVTSFFLEKDMVQGKVFNFRFNRSSYAVNFLPSSLAKKTPFSSKQLPLILDLFSVRPDSPEAEEMKKTIKVCELDGEGLRCVTSMQEMVEYVISKLGKDVQVVSTEVDKETNGLDKYTFQGMKLVADNGTAVCHKMIYPYVIYGCHQLSDTKMYRAQLDGASGAQARAIAVCHGNTTTWNPEHEAFKMVKAKPGTVAICHFLYDDAIAWIKYK